MHQLRFGRRLFLASAGVAVGLGTVVGGASPAFTPLAKQPVDLRDRWTEILTARARLDIVGPRIRELLHRSDAEVRAFLRVSEEAPVGSVFPEYPLDDEDSGALSSTATRLAAMARAWVTPASEWFGDGRLREAIIEGVETLVQRSYRPGAKPYGNWWNWEIGTPRPLADLMCMMREELPPGTLREAGEAIRYFVPDPRYSELMNHPTTGSGRVNTCRGALVAALVEEDGVRVSECVEALPEAWGIVDSADGFYDDGGFIHHINVAYTGSYGVELIDNLAPLLALINGSEFDTIDREALWDRIDDAFLPVMVNGHMMDFVRGRAVARTRSSGSTIGRAALAAIAEIAADAPSARRKSWFGQFDRWAQRNPTLDLLAGSDIPGAVALAEVEGHAADTDAETGSAYFSSMDRLVHRAPGWTLAIAMCSNRIAAYEASEQENAWASRTGNAMHYLFVDDDPAPFDDHFWATLDYVRPPGTTNHGSPLVEAPTRGMESKVPDNEWTGGLVHGAISIAAMHQVGLDGDAPRCRRLVVAMADMVIELVSDVQTSSTPFTAVENRMFPEGEAPDLVVNGERVHDEVTINNPQWAHLEGVAGFLFLSGGTVTARESLRLGSQSRVERTIAEIDNDDQIRRRWAGIDLVHGGAGSSDAWVVLPGASRSVVRQAAESRTSSFAASVARNDATGQVVDAGDGFTIAAVWRAFTLPLETDLKIRLPQPLIILVQQTEDRILLVVSEPTQEQERSILQVTGSWVVEDTSGISLTHIEVTETAGSTELSFNTSNRGGRSFTVSIRPS